VSERLSEKLARIIRELDAEKSGFIGPGEPLLSYFILPDEHLGLQETLSDPTFQDTGTFLVGTARVGFCDCA